ncbi:uncharacterized protein LOC135497682 [Lineus longissimus]|uniref:uncharacterized protein LOC135497682 n=1 Tax=Lineus longissimus TaxID=88925 RepID=UPI00315E0276
MDIDPIHFRIGNGEFVHATKAINIELLIQGHKLRIHAVVADNLTGPDLLLGARTLSELNGTLDFSTSTLTVRPRRIQFTPVQTVTLRPGQTRSIVVKGKVPKLLKHTEVLLQPTEQFSKYCPSYMLVKLRKSAAIIRVTNNSKKNVTFRDNLPVAFTDLSDHIHATHLVPRGSLNNGVTREQCVSDLHYKNLLTYPHLDIDDPISKLSPQDIIEQQISLQGSTLSADEKQHLYELLLRNKEAFSLYGEIGTCPNFEVDIQLKDDSPFFVRPYPIPEKNRKQIDKEFNKLVNLGILKKGCSAYSSPVMLIGKKGTTDKRIISDFRYLNSRCKTVNQNFVSLQSVLARLGRSNCKVELKSAFHSLPLIPNQAELNKVLKVIKRKVIRDYNLPFDGQQFRIAQQTSPFFFR